MWLKKTSPPPEKFRFKCRCCGEWHEEIPAVAFAMPDSVFRMDEDERAERVELNSEFCVVDARWCYVRLVLRVPIQGCHETFDFGLWVLVGSSEYDEIWDSWNEENGEDRRIFSAWLSPEDVPAPFVAKSSLLAKVHLQGYPTRPLLELQATRHPLSVAQRKGLSVEQVVQIIEPYMHPAGQAE